MKLWAWWIGMALVASIAATGCGSSASTAVTVTISPTTATVLLNNSVQFTGVPSDGTSTVTWSVNGTTGGSSTVGTIDTTGFYTAPAAIPANTAITVTATVGSQTATATVTLISGAAVTLTPTAITIGTGETYPFQVTVTGIPANAITASCNSANPASGLPSCSAVTWAVSTGTGSVDGNGLYTAPGAVENDVVTATSVYDPTIAATATISVVTAADPTISSVTPHNGAIGAVQQDIYLSGTNFISTTSVFVNGVPQPTSAVLANATTVLRVRLSADELAAAPPSGSSTVSLTITAAQQNGSPQQCSPDPTQCVVTLVPVHPVIVGATPDSLSQSNFGGFSFNINGGFFGTSGSPRVNAQFAGQPQSSTVSTTNPARQLSVNLNLSSGSLSQVGLYPVSVSSNIPGANVPPAVANIAVQPSYGPSAVGLLSTLPVGVTPYSVAVNSATGTAVVANQGSNDITLIDLTQPTPAVTVPSVCTGAVGLTPPCPANSAAPTGVAVDNVRNIALVANSANDTVAVVNLATHSVAYIISTVNIGGGTPAAVGINPVSGRAIVVYRSTNNATLLDLTPWPAAPTIIGAVSVGTGPTPRVAVSPKLNWALVTPGGGGALSIVDLSRQSVTPIAAVSRTSGTVTVTTAASHLLQTGEAVLIQGIGNSSFNGIFTVTSTPSNNSFTYIEATSLPNATSSGGTASYALPVASVGTNIGVTGVAIDDETGKTLLVDPNGVVPGTIFNALDQSSLAVPNLGTGNVGAAMSPFANIAVAVNEFTNQVTIIDPGGLGGSPAVLATFTAGNHPWDVAIDPGTEIALVINQNDNTASIFSLATPRSAPQILESTPSQIIVGASLSSSPAPLDQVLTLVGKNFTPSSVARLDGTPLTTLSVTDRTMTVTVPAALQTQARQYALDVVNSGVASNASTLTIAVSVDVSGVCSSASPTGVALDIPNNVAVVTDPGCNDVYLVNLTNAMGQVVAVGTNPSGVAVQASGSASVVANTGSNNVSVLDDVGAAVTATISTGVGPAGVAIDPGTGHVVVANTQSSTASVFTLGSPTGTTPTSVAVQQGPVSVAVDPAQQLAAVGNATSNNVNIVDLTQNVASQTSGTIQYPQGIVFDPVLSDFLVAASLQNQVDVLSLASATQTSIRVGVNPTSLAYNFDTATLVTTNSLGQSMTVVDNIDRQVRSISRLTPAGQFSVDIHPFTNIAVVADSLNKRILMLPVAR